MKLLKVISRLLDYPTDELQQAKAPLVELIKENSDIDDDSRQLLLALVEQLCDGDIYDIQANYDALFEKGRSVSLLLFEHVHGESKERGQAMVDLMNIYQSRGYNVAVKELPDYLPLFLEFLSEQELEFIQEYLQDIAHILALIETRLHKKGSQYACLFTVLIQLSGAEVSAAEIVAQVNAEKPDDTFAAIDEAWEDKEIRFDDQLGQQNGACPASQPSSEVAIDVAALQSRKAQPIHTGE